jgi:zinc protease
MSRILETMSVVALLGAGCASTPASPPPAARTAPVVEAPAPVPEAVQGNGRLILVPVPGSQSVAFRLLFYTGSIDDPAGKEGLTALTAHLMAEGGTASRTYPELLKALYPLAAEISVEVDKEQTVFSGAVHVDVAEKFLSLLSEVVLAPAFDKLAFERLRKDAVNDIQKRLRATDDENLGKELLNLMLHQGSHPYGHFAGGSVQALQRFTLEDVRAHAAAVFGKQRLLIGVAGATEALDAQTLQKIFDTLGRGRPRVATINVPPVPNENELWIAFKPTAKAVAISIGFPHWARRGHADWAALALIQSYFGEHRQFHGVLMDELREKRGLNYGDYAYVESFQQEGWGRLARNNVARRSQHFEIWIRPVAPEDAVFALRLALYHLDKLVRQGVTKADLVGVRRFLKGYTNLFAMTPMRKLGYALDDDFYGTKGYLKELNAGLDALTVESVNEALRRHLVTQPVRIAIVAKHAMQLSQRLTDQRVKNHVYPTSPPKAVLDTDLAARDLSLRIEERNVKVIPVDELFEN